MLSGLRACGTLQLIYSRRFSHIVYLTSIAFLPEVKAIDIMIHEHLPTSSDLSFLTWFLRRKVVNDDRVLVTPYLFETVIFHITSQAQDRVAVTTTQFVRFSSLPFDSLLLSFRVGHVLSFLDILLASYFTAWICWHILSNLYPPRSSEFTNSPNNALLK